MDLHFCLCHRARQIWVINQIYSQAMLQYTYCECDACVIFLICTEEPQLWHYLKPRQYFITAEKWDFIPSSEFTFFIFLLGTNSLFPSLFSTRSVPLSSLSGLAWLLQTPSVVSFYCAQIKLAKTSNEITAITTSVLRSKSSPSCISYFYTNCTFHRRGINVLIGLNYINF